MGFGRGKGQEGRGERGGAHQGLDLGGEDLGEGARRRGVEFGKNSNGGRDGNVRFGRDSAQTGTGWCGDGGRQGCWSLGAANRDGMVRGGRRNGRRRALLDLAPREPEDGDGREEKRETALRPDKLAQRGARGSSTADAWSGADEHSRRYGRRAPQRRVQWRHCFFV